MTSDGATVAPSRHHARIPLATDCVIVALGLLVMYGPTFFDLGDSLWQTDDHAHGPILFGITVWLVWQRRHVFTMATRPTAPFVGSVIFGAGLLFYVVGRSQAITAIEVGSLIFVASGLLLMLRGWRSLQEMLFPLAFVGFMVPLPGLVIDAITGPLKQLVSTVAERALYVAGYPIARSGVALTIGQYQLLVADACSGLNSIFSLAALGLFYTYIARSNRVHAALMLASVLPIALAANMVRVITLVLITYHYGDHVAQGIAHGLAGMALFGVALLMLLAVDVILRTVVGLGQSAQ